MPYITLLTDLEQARVIDVMDDRTTEAAEQLWQTFTPEQKQAVEAVAVDMWEPFIQTIQREVGSSSSLAWRDAYNPITICIFCWKRLDHVRRIATPAGFSIRPKADEGNETIFSYCIYNRSSPTVPSPVYLAIRLRQLR
jgi:hypothetical protein